MEGIQGTEQQTKAPNKGRKAAAIGPLGLGVAGMALGAATQLDLLWAGKYQAGAVDVNADCQLENETITVSFGDPAFEAGEDIPWEITTAHFTDVSDECTGLDYEVAYRTDGDWTSLDKGKVANKAIAVTIPSGKVQDITEFALTIHG